MVGIYWAEDAERPAVFVLSEDTFIKFTKEPQVFSLLGSWCMDNKDSKIVEKELTVW